MNKNKKVIVTNLKMMMTTDLKNKKKNNIEWPQEEDQYIEDNNKETETHDKDNEEVDDDGK